MAEEVKSFGDLKSTLIKAKPPKRRPKTRRSRQGQARRQGPRLCDRPAARTRSRASGSNPASARITVNGREEKIYFARPVLRMILRQPLIAANRDGQFDVICHGGGRRVVGAGGRGASRHFASAARLRTRACVPCSSKAASSPAIRAPSSARSTAVPRPAAASSSRSADRVVCFCSQQRSGESLAAVLLSATTHQFDEKRRHFWRLFACDKG